MGLKHNPQFKRRPPISARFSHRRGILAGSIGLFANLIVGARAEDPAALPPGVEEVPVKPAVVEITPAPAGVPVVESPLPVKASNETAAPDPGAVVLVSQSESPAPTVEELEPGSAQVVEELDGSRPPVEKPSWKLALVAELKAVYDDNIFISARDPDSDFSFRVAPTVAVGWGDFRGQLFAAPEMANRYERARAIDNARNFLFLSYTPTGQIFLDHSDENVVTHDVRLKTRAAFKKLEINAEARVQTLADPVPELGKRSDRTVTALSLAAEYTFSERTAVSVFVSADWHDWDEGLDSNEFRVQSILDYRVLPKLKLGFGGGIGYLDVDRNPSQVYEQVLASVKYEPTRKLEFIATGGVDFRETDGGGGETTPVFAVSSNFSPSENTKFTVSAFRALVSSPTLIGEIVDRTGVDVGVRQQLFEHFFVAFNGGYSLDEYERIGSGIPSNRTDDRWYFGCSIGCELSAWSTIQASFRHEENESSVDSLTYDRNIVELTMEARF